MTIVAFAKTNTMTAHLATEIGATRALCGARVATTQAREDISTLWTCKRCAAKSAA